MVITGSFNAPSSFSTPVSKSSTSKLSNCSWKTQAFRLKVQSSLSFYVIEVDAVRSQPGLIHSSQIIFVVQKDHPSGVPTCEIP